MLCSDVIVELANEFGPSDLSSNEEERTTGALTDLCLQELGQAGTAILVFLLYSREVGLVYP